MNRIQRLSVRRELIAERIQDTQDDLNHWVRMNTADAVKAVGMSQLRERGVQIPTGQVMARLVAKGLEQVEARIAILRKRLACLMTEDARLVELCRPLPKKDQAIVAQVDKELQQMREGRQNEQPAGT